MYAPAAYPSQFARTQIERSAALLMQAREESANLHAARAI